MRVRRTRTSSSSWPQPWLRPAGEGTYVCNVSDGTYFHELAFGSIHFIGNASVSIFLLFRASFKAAEMDFCYPAGISASPLSMAADICLTVAEVFPRESTQSLL